MRRPFAIAGSAVFLVVAPGTVAGFLPWLFSGWRMRAPLFGVAAFRLVGIVSIIAGTAVLLDSFARFAWQGLGTPAPVAPPKHLVVTGLYRYVRNPMYVAIMAVILGQALLLGSVALLEYAVVVWIGFTAFVMAYEEPILRSSFGRQYEEFCAQVPRWIPRVRPWHRGESKPGRDTHLTDGDDAGARKSQT